MSQERRRHPRVAKSLSLQLSHTSDDIITETSNISASGAYCIMKRFIPVLTKMRVKLSVPDERTSKTISCEGIVVRVEPAHEQSKPTDYKVAIFFHDLTEHDRTVLAHYVQQHISAAI